MDGGCSCRNLVKEWTNEQALWDHSIYLFERKWTTISLFIRCWCIYQERAWDRRCSLHLSQGHLRSNSRDPNWLRRVEKGSVLVSVGCCDKNNRHLFLIVLEAEIWDPSVSRACSLWGLSPWLLDSCLLPVSSHGLCSVCVWVLITSFYKDTR